MFYVSYFLSKMPLLYHSIFVPQFIRVLYAAIPSASPLSSLVIISLLNLCLNLSSPVIYIVLLKLTPLNFCLCPPFEFFVLGLCNINMYLVAGFFSSVAFPLLTHLITLLGQHYMSPYLFMSPRLYF